MALFRGIQVYIALDANNITLVFDSRNIVNISGNIFLYPPQGHPILYNCNQIEQFNIINIDSNQIQKKTHTCARYTLLSIHWLHLYIGININTKGINNTQHRNDSK